MPLVVHLLLALGLAQGIFLVWQLWRLRWRNPIGYLHLLLALAAVLLVLLEQWLVHAGAWRAYPHLVRATVWMPFLFGPGLWLFVRGLDGPVRAPRDGLHYLPAVLALLWFLPWLLQGGDAKRAFVEGTTAIPLESSLIGLAKVLSLVGYMVAIRWRLRRGATDRLRRRFASATSVFLLFLGALSLHFAAGHWWREWAVPSDTFGALGLALFFYVASAIAVAYWRDFAQSLAPAGAPAPTADAATAVPGAAPVSEPDRARSPRLDAATSARVYADIAAQVAAREIYREPGLSLDALAGQVGLPAHYLSFVVNAGSGQNVQAWLNRHRVDAAKQALLAEPERSVLDIGLASGFNAKASFNRAFKAATGCSPSEFRAANASQIQN
jgi:AraC-like DNA-binding protein